MTLTQQMLLLLDHITPWSIEQECEKRQHNCKSCGMTKICEDFHKVGLLPLEVPNGQV